MAFAWVSGSAHSARARSEIGFSRANWAKFAEFGWLAIGVPEAFGGLGGCAVETAIPMEALGRALAVEPYLTTAVLGAGLLDLGVSDEHKRELFPTLASGKSHIAFAFTEAQSRYDPGAAKRA